MMDPLFSSAFIQGYECLAAWSDLLDQINVFPVADADTGRNLKISLAPLRLLAEKPTEVSRQMLRAATGNAGNIAAAFFQSLVELQRSEDLAAAVDRGLRQACRAVADPKPGTMLTLFESLANALPPAAQPPTAWDLEAIVAHLEKCVADTSDTLPELRRAGVVDAGALGMFIFMEAFLGSLAGRNHHRPVTERFNGKLTIADQWQPDESSARYCVSALIQSDKSRSEARELLSDCGESVVINAGVDGVKVHLHTDDRDTLRSGLAQIGQVVSWREESIESIFPAAHASQPVHVMTDAAGSVTREDALCLGMTLLDSYLVVGDQSWPETLSVPDALYAAMGGGQKVSTAQASTFQRHQSYLSALSRFPQVLYLCVGSVYTGNFATATAWQTANDPDGRLTILDSGAASGRLGNVALATAHYARQGHDMAKVLDFARRAMAQSQELVFLDQLKFLAAGGRISKTQGFFGDLLHMKPIMTPLAHGAAKVGVVRHRKDQLAFARKRLESSFAPGAAPLILLQYTDNRAWVEEVVAQEVRKLLPVARILLRPLSLTSGAHMGPGTWGVAFLPEAFDTLEPRNAS
ncbi:MAG: DegV family EDD domain-containing protein [Desulfobacterales bacterium]|nr:DegV family EDD domain-containing protein [Desulfobacterales bacterium]